MHSKVGQETEKMTPPQNPLPVYALTCQSNSKKFSQHTKICTASSYRLNDQKPLKKLHKPQKTHPFSKQIQPFM
jgi:uncharacterized Rmd1/YagE family protein